MAGIINKILRPIDAGFAKLLSSQHPILTSLDRAFVRGFGEAKIERFAPIPVAAGNVFMMSGKGPDLPIDIFSPAMDGIIHRFKVGDTVTGEKGQFRVVRQFADGGMATIFLVTDERGKESLLKVMKEFPEQPREIRDEVRLRFAKEATIMGDIKSQYVVSLIDRDPQPFPMFYIMEKIPGRDLRTVIDDFMRSRAQDWATKLMQKKGEAEMSPDTWNLAWRKAEEDARLRGLLTLKINLGILFHTLTGLNAFEKAARACLGEGNVSHRDIKPDNIFIEQDKDDRIKRAVLGDFGIARIPGSQQTRTHQFMGTLGYAAPETFTGAKIADQRSDIFSLGATLCFMLTGTDPFPSEDPSFIYNFTKDPQKFVTDLSAKRPYHIPLPVWQAALKAVAPNPADRFQTYREFAELIVGFLKTM
ncbi:MAG TPA: serine/threonine-protein kinase [Candidatus Omnitrophota bacterium]|nr:serine/threonine-protein kinase [Candidatus Omnitrophota bacterium]